MCILSLPASRRYNPSSCFFDQKAWNELASDFDYAGYQKFDRSDLVMFIDYMLGAEQPAIEVESVDS